MRHCKTCGCVVGKGKSYCVSCLKVRQRNYYTPKTPLETRACTVCGSSFTTSVPHQTACTVQCRRQRNRKPRCPLYGAEYRKKNADEIKAKRSEKRKRPGERVFRNWYAAVQRHKTYTGTLEEWAYYVERRSVEDRPRKTYIFKPKRAPKYAGMSPAEVWKHKYKTDPTFNAWERHRNQFKKWFSGEKRTNTIARTIGYSREELRRHLEKQFSNGMGWHNAGQWHIDHIIPKNLFDPTDQEEVAKCWSMSNLRPLWGTDNCRRPRDGSDVLV